MLGIEDEGDKKEPEDYRTPQEKAIAEIMKEMFIQKANRRNWS
jgi:hypothetical protein